MKYAVIYNRISKSQTEIIDKDESVINYIKDKELSLKTIYQDVDCSAFDYARPEFNRLLKGAIEHEYEFVIIPKVYKLTRSVSDLMLLVNWFNKLGVTVYFCDINLEVGLLNYKEAFDGMVESIENEIIKDNFEDEIEVCSNELKSCLNDYEVLDTTFVNCKED